MTPPNPPEWLKQEIGRNKAALRSAEARRTENTLGSQALHTVCVSALCPNKGKCFAEGDATFLILGDICTRGCKFCAVGRGQPLPPDGNEPARIAQTAAGWKLKFAVITSPTRDDLSDGGAEHYATVIRTLQERCPGIGTEVLTPDFAGNRQSIKTVIDANPNVFAHNVETVPRLYETVRKGAIYRRSLDVLAYAKQLGAATKSGLMLGLGETETEIKTVLNDLLACGCDILTLGQYLAPSKNHAPVVRYPEREEYAEWDAYARKAGFKAVMSGPLVRSSYLAGKLYSEFHSHAG